MITDEKIEQLIGKISDYAESVDREVFGIPIYPETTKEIIQIVRNWLEENGLVEKEITVKNDPVCKKTDCTFYNEKYSCYCSNVYVNPMTCDPNSHYTKRLTNTKEKPVVAENPDKCHRTDCEFYSIALGKNNCMLNFVMCKDKEFAYYTPKPTNKGE